MASSPPANHLLTTCIKAARTGDLIPLPDFLTVPNLSLNLCTIAAFTWGGLYVLLEPVAGTALAMICLAVAAACNYFVFEYPALTTQIAVITHIVCWIFQFIGHGAFEGRAPALLDNLVQAIFLAPLFVWLEMLFKFGGCEWEGDGKRACMILLSRRVLYGKNGY